MCLIGLVESEMKAGTAMDPFPDSYEGDPMANVRTEEPPRDPVDEEDEGSEDSDTSGGEDPQPVDADDEAAALRAATEKLSG